MVILIDAENSFGDTGAVALSRALKVNRTLLSLSLSCLAKVLIHGFCSRTSATGDGIKDVPALSESGVTTLCAALKFNYVLRSLELCMSRQIFITNDSVFHCFVVLFHSTTQKRKSNQETHRIISSVLRLSSHPCMKRRKQPCHSIYPKKSQALNHFL